MDAVSLIQKHEGLRLKPYTDTVGKCTIGYGRNLSDNGITAMEALMMLQGDYTELFNRLLALPWFQALNEPRQGVILDMGFNLGYAALMQFQGMIDAIQAGDYAGAAAHMLNSKWANQVGDRATEDAQIMDTGNWPA